MSPMVIAQAEKEMRPIRPTVRSNNPYFVQLVKEIPPQPIEDKTMHARYSDLVKKLTLILVRARKAIAHDRQTREAVEGLGQYTKMIAELVEHYEKEHSPTGKADPIETLEFLMEQHGLSQIDLAKEFGGQPVVSAVLAGRRPLNKNHILKLAARFHVSPAMFLPAA